MSSGDCQPSRPRRFYGRSATTSVTQLLSESDVVKTCTNLIQRLTTKNLVSPSSGSERSTRGTEFNGTMRSNNGPDSPIVELKSQRKNSGVSTCSDYNYVKYKPPLPTTNHSSNLALTGGTDASKGGGSRLSFSYFGNDRLKELEQKFSERYSRIFGSSANVTSSAGTDGNGNSVGGSGSGITRENRNNLRNRTSIGSKEALNTLGNLNSYDDFRNYGLSKSASTCGGNISSRLPYTGSQTSAYGSTLGLGNSEALDKGSRGGSRLAVTNLSTPTSRNVDYNVRRNFGLSKSASSSVIQDSGRYGGLTSAVTANLPGTGSTSSSYYNPYVGYGSNRLYASNSHLLEPVPEQHQRPKVDSGGYVMMRGRDESSGVPRSGTLNNLDRALMDDYREDSRAGTVKAESGDEEDNGSTAPATSAAGVRKNSYKLPSRYYYRRYRHKSSYAQPKEASPLTLTNKSSRTKENSAEDEDNNNLGKSRSKAVSRTSSFVSNSGNNNGPSRSSHVLAYDLSRSKTLRDGDDLSYGSTTGGSSSSGYETGESLKENKNGKDISPNDGGGDVDLIRKKEIEDLIRKYSGFTYKSSKYVQLKTPGAAGTSATAEDESVANGEENGAPSKVRSQNHLNHQKPPNRLTTNNNHLASSQSSSALLGTGSSFQLQTSGSKNGLSGAGGDHYYDSTTESKGYLSSKESNNAVSNVTKLLPLSSKSNKIPKL